ncbi:hypothetical protein BDZ91DRAFT_745877 [Kalaharituber pfeilii]|nr:hypothetical protein BDZ91DRAFT_745877 [Kalaharituber pfeilii]
MKLLTSPHKSLPHCRGGAHRHWRLLIILSVRTRSLCHLSIVPFPVPIVVELETPPTYVPDSPASSGLLLGLVQVIR